MNEPLPEHLHLQQEKASTIQRVHESESTFFNDTLKRPWLSLPDAPAPAAPSKAELDAEGLTADGVLDSLLREAGLLDAAQPVPTAAPALASVDPVQLAAFNRWPSYRTHLMASDRMLCIALETAQLEQAEARATSGAATDPITMIAMMASQQSNAQLYARAVEQRRQDAALRPLLIAGPPVRSVADIFFDLKMQAQGGAL